MLNGPDHFTWTEAALVLASLLLTGFLVSWVVTDIVGWTRQVYVGVLALVTAAATAAVLAATGTAPSDMVGHRWLLGLLGAVVAGLLASLGLRRKEGAAVRRPAAVPVVAAAWEGLVYGVVEGLLLSVLPVLVVWQAAADAGWGDATARVAALAASIAMIAIHHFGYWDYRSGRVVLAIFGCGVLTLSYLVTGSVLAPALGHALLHVIGIAGGVELPPHVPPAPADVVASPV